jgi:predicted DNA-binding transcriptional regulator AlpA
MRQDELEGIRAKEIWRNSDLDLLGYGNRKTRRRWVETEGFPEPIILGPNSIGWIPEEVRDWTKRRARGAAPQPSRPRA